MPRVLVQSSVRARGGEPLFDSCSSSGLERYKSLARLGIWTLNKHPRMKSKSLGYGSRFLERKARQAMQWLLILFQPEPKTSKQIDFVSLWSP